MHPHLKVLARPRAQVYIRNGSHSITILGPAGAPGDPCSMLFKVSHSLLAMLMKTCMPRKHFVESARELVGKG